MALHGWMVSGNGSYSRGWVTVCLHQDVHIHLLQHTLHEARRIILAGGDGSIVDTVWFDKTMTLVDYISEELPPNTPDGAFEPASLDLLQAKLSRAIALQGVGDDEAAIN